MVRPEFDCIDHEAHRWFWWEYVLFLSDELLQNIILQCTSQFFYGHSLFFGRGNIHSPNDRCWAINGHTCADLVQRDIFKQNLHIL